MTKVTLITGAGRGIGKQIAIKFAEKKNNLILLVQKNQQKKELSKLLIRF